jgi:hypothetical protein
MTGVDRSDANVADGITTIAPAMKAAAICE